MALVQEMAVKIDQGFLDAIAALFSPDTNLQNDGQKVKRSRKWRFPLSSQMRCWFEPFVFQSGLIEGDLKRLQAEPTDATLSDASGLSFFEHFHISPIKVTSVLLSSLAAFRLSLSRT